MNEQAISEARAEPDDATVTSIEAGAFGSFSGGVALTFATRLLMLVGVIGSSVIVARWLGPEGFGTLGVLNATIALALQIGSAGLPSANTYFIARDRRSLGPVWANSVVFAIAAGSLLAAGVVLLDEIKPALFGGVTSNLLMIAALSIPFQMLFLLGLNVLLAMGRIGQLNFLDAMSPALTLVNAIVVLVLLRAKLAMLVSFNTVAAVFLGLGMLWLIWRMLPGQQARRAYRPSFRLLKGMVAYGLKFYTSIMASVVIFRADLLIVNHYRGTGEAGVYAVASQVSFLLMLLPGVIAMLLFPRVASDQDPRGEFAMRVNRHTSFVMLVICLAAVAGSFLLPPVYGPRFADATIQLLILLPGIYLVGIESVLVQHFTGIGLPVAIPIFWVVTLAVNIGLNLALVPAYGGRGAACASVISYSLIFFLVAFYFRFKTGNSLSNTFLLRRHELRDLFATMRPRFRANV